MLFLSGFKLYSRWVPLETVRYSRSWQDLSGYTPMAKSAIVLNNGIDQEL